MGDTRGLFVVYFFVVGYYRSGNQVVPRALKIRFGLLLLILLLQPGDRHSYFETLTDASNGWVSGTTAGHRWPAFESVTNDSRPASNKPLGGFLMFGQVLSFIPVTHYSVLFRYGLLIGDLFVVR